MYCRKCGQNNEDNALRCIKCGAVIQNIEPAIPQKDRKVSSHLAPAILTTIFCCLPFGIVAIVNAAMVNGRLVRGDYEGALRASNNAKIWCWVAFASVVLYIAFLGILAAIAIPQFSVYRMRSYDAAAQADLRNAVVAQEAYYIDNSTYCKSIHDLEGDAYGFYISEGVTIEIISADEYQYQMSAFHKGGNKKFRIIGPGGTIEEFFE